MNKVRIGIVLLMIQLGIPSVFAADKPQVKCGDGALPGCDSNISIGAVFTNLVPTVINFVIFGIAIVSFAFLVKGGIDMILALGQEEKMKKAVGSMVSAVIGLAVALLSYAIVAAIVSLKIFG